MSDSSEPRGHDLLIRGMRVRYYELGTGAPLLLVHGFLVNSREWRLVMPRLARRFRVIAPDLPGFGESERPREYRYDREGYAETLSYLLAGLDVPRAHVAGHSFGGSVSIVLAADHPERVSRLALIASVSYPFELPLSGKVATAPIVGPLVFRHLYTRPLFHRFFKNTLYAPGFAYDRAEVDRFYDAFNSPDARDAASRVFPHTNDVWSLGPKIPKVRAPTLVLWGERDALFPVSFGARLVREIDGARMETFPNCGHSPAEEAPERTADLLIRHFASEPN